MVPHVDRLVAGNGRRHGRGLGAVAMILVAFTLGGCGVVNAVRKVENVAHNMEANKALIDTFSNNLKSEQPTRFEAIYETTGSSPTTTIYAVSPPHALAFKNTPSASGTGVDANLDVVVNPSGEYACSGSASAWSCEKLRAADAATENKVFDLYTPAHWVAFLDEFALAAGLAGDAVSRSSMSVNGFSMQCVDLKAPGVPGTSTICTTPQGILGYVKVASDNASFEITRYSTSPAASLFELPSNAKVTSPQ